MTKTDEFDPSTARIVSNNKDDEFDPSTAKLSSDTHDPNSRSWGTALSDIGNSIASGAAAAGRGILGLSDLVTGSNSIQNTKNLGLDIKSSEQAWKDNLSEKAKQEEQAWNNTQGFVDTLKYGATHPFAVANKVAESLPAMAVSGGMGGAVAKGVVGGAIGEGMQQSGSSYADAIEKNNGNTPTDKDAGAALGSGVTTATISALSGGLAKKLGIGDIDTAIANRVAGEGATSARPLGLGAYAKNIGEGIITEGTLEELPQSATEQMWQNYADDKPIMEGVPEAAAQGLITGGLMGGAFNATNLPTFNESQNNQGNQDGQGQSSGPMPEVLPPDGSNGLPNNVQPNTFDGSYRDLTPSNAPQLTNDPQPEGAPASSNNTPSSETPTPNGLGLNLLQLNNTTSETPEVQAGNLSPSQELGIDPNQGGLSSAAAVAVDTGASPITAELQRQATQSQPNEQTNWLNGIASPTDQSQNEAPQLGYSPSENTDTPPAQQAQVADLWNSQDPQQRMAILGRIYGNEDMARQNALASFDRLPKPAQQQIADIAVQNGAVSEDNNTQSSNGQTTQTAPQAPLTTLAQDIAPDSQANTAPAIEPILGKDGKNKWFATQNKANEFIQKKSLGDNYTIEQTGKMRYEIVPKVQPQAEQTAQPNTEPSSKVDDQWLSDFTNQMLQDKQLSSQLSNPSNSDELTFSEFSRKFDENLAKNFTNSTDNANEQSLLQNKNDNEIAKQQAYQLAKAQINQNQQQPTQANDASSQQNNNVFESAGTPKNREGLLLDYQTHSDAIDKDIESRGLTEQLHSIAGATTERPFSEMSKEKQAKAYADLVESGAKPAHIMETSDEQAARLEQSAEMRRLQSTDTIAQKNGKPFKQQQAAEKIIQENNLRFTHEVKQVDGGFILKQLSPAAQQEAKNKADGIESYTDIQSRVAKDMGVSTNEYGEYDVSDEQFAEMNKRVDAIQREQRGLKPIQDGGNTEATQPKLYGKESYIQTGSERQPTRVAVVEADSLTPDDKNTDNQFRDRTRSASQMQIDSIANNLDPRQLTDSTTMATGAPTLANDGKTIIAGNGRTKAIKQAYAQGKGAEYKQSLIEQAQSLGIDPQQIAGMKNPVLVKEFANPVDVKKMAIESNATGGLAMSAKEQARADSALMPDMSMLASDDKGNINLSRNAHIFRKFISSLPVEAQASMLDKDGLLSKEGLSRLQNAVLYKAYGDSKAFDDMVENTDVDVKNAINGLTQVAPKIAQTKESINQGTSYDADISDDITAALSLLQQIRKNEMSVSDYLSQMGLFDDGLSPVAKEFIQYIDANIRSAKAIADLLSAYYDNLDKLGNPNQQDLLGGKPNTDKQSLFKQALEQVRNAKQPTKQQTDLFSQSDADTAGQPATQADNAVEQRPSQSQGDGAGVGTSESAKPSDEQVKTALKELVSDDVWSGKKALIISPVFVQKVADQLGYQGDTQNKADGTMSDFAKQVNDVYGGVIKNQANLSNQKAKGTPQPSKTEVYADELEKWVANTKSAAEFARSVTNLRDSQLPKGVNVDFYNFIAQAIGAKSPQTIGFRIKLEEYWLAANDTKNNNAQSTNKYEKFQSPIISDDTFENTQQQTNGAKEIKFESNKNYQFEYDVNAALDADGFNQEGDFLRLDYKNKNQPLSAAKSYGARVFFSYNQTTGKVSSIISVYTDSTHKRSIEITNEPNNQYPKVKFETEFYKPLFDVVAKDERAFQDYIDSGKWQAEKDAKREQIKQNFIDNKPAIFTDLAKKYMSASLVGAAGVETAEQFRGLSDESQAEAFAKLVEQTGYTPPRKKAKPTNVKEGIAKTRAKKQTAKAKPSEPKYSQMGNGQDDKSAFDSNNNDIRYSQMGEYTPDLIVTHNLTADAIIHADKIGGLPFASIAITKQDNPLTGFGEVTLIGDKNLIDPKGVNKAKVFGSDIYSPRYPRVVVKADSKKLAQFNKDLESARQVIESSQQISEEDFAGKYNVLNDNLVKLHFLQQNGVNIERKYREVEEEVNGNKDQIDSAKADVKSLEQFADAFGVDSVEQYLAQATDSEIYTKVQDIGENNPDAFDAIFKTLADAKVERSPFKTRVRMVMDNIRMSRGKTGNYLIGSLQSMAGVVSGRTQLVEDGVRKKQVFDYSDTINQIDKALTDNNLEQAFNDYIDNVRSDLVVDERLDNGVTPTGARRTVAHTIENVVKKLKKDLRGGESFNYGLPSIRAKVTPQFKTIQQIQESKDKIITSEQFDLIKKEIDDEMSALSDKLGLESHLDVGDFLADVIDNGADKAFDFFNVKNSVPNKKLVADFLAKLKDMPTTYFEVKAKEVTQFSDFTGAVVPNSISHKARNILEQAGLKLYTYGSNVGVERADAIKQATTELNNTNGNILFSQTNDTESKLRSELQSLMAMQKQASQGLSLTERANSKQLREIIRRIDETKSELQKVLDKKSQPMQSNSGKENLIVSEYTGSRTVYHGTKAAVADEIMQNGIKFGTQLNDGDYRGGGYGVIQNSTSASLDPNVSKNFSNDAKPSIVKIQLADDAKIITIENEMYAEDLEDYADELKGVDAVYLANNGEQEIVILNKDKVKVVESRGFSIRDAIPRFSVLNQEQGQVQSQAPSNPTNRTKSNQAAVQNITKILSDKFGKATIDKLIADGNLEIIDYAEAKRRNPKTPSNADGYYADGKAVLIADNLSSDMIIPTFLHELGGHGGLQTLMSDKAYQSLMKEFDRMVAEGNQLAIEAKAFADATSPNAKVAQDEYLPYLISLAAKAQGNSKVKSMINRIVMAVKSFMRDKFGVSLKVTPADIVALAEKMVSERAMQSNATASMPTQYSKQTPQTEIDQVREQYEGTDQWMKAPNGKPTNLTEKQWLQVRTPSFKAWFGDWENDPANASKIVDENGEPLVVYHGTNAASDFYTFDIDRLSSASGDSGYFGAGLYFTHDLGNAKSYGRSLMQTFLNIRSPVYDNTESVKPLLPSFGIEEQRINVDKQWLTGAIKKADKNAGILAELLLGNNRKLDYATIFSMFESRGGKKTSNGLDLDRVYSFYDSFSGTLSETDFLYIENKISDIPDSVTEIGYDRSVQIIKLTKNGKYAQKFTDAAIENNKDGVVIAEEGASEYVVFEPNQIKSATNNNGTFDPNNNDIRYSQMGGNSPQVNKLSKVLSEFLKNPLSFIKTASDNKVTDNLGKALALLGRRQLVDIYKKDLPPIKEYSDIVEQMDADSNEKAYEADKLVKEWGKLKDELPLAELMHDATLKGIDPAEAYQTGDDRAIYQQLRRRYDALSPDAKRIYKQARDDYKAQQRSVFEAIKGRIQRTDMSAPRQAELIRKMEQGFFFGQKVYFPLARFGNYVVAVKDAAGNIVSVSRAETQAQANQLRKELIAQYPNDKVGRVMLDKEFVSSRDGVTRGFMSDLFDAVDKLNISSQERAEFEDTLGQLYLNSLPDISFAKSGMHRKGTAGFSQNARRAYAQHMSRGSHYIAKMRHSDVLQAKLDEMQEYVKAQGEADPNYDQPKMQRVVDEMEKRHESLMNNHTAGWSSLATSVGFMWYMGLSPASALVNLSQTALVAYPIMGAKWGFSKAGKELLIASGQASKALNNLQSSLSGDEKTAFDEAVKRGVIDMTQAHDLAGVARGEDDSVMWKIRKPMEWASFMFHHAEKFNRQVTFVASYRLAKQAGANHKQAIEQAIDATYEGHFSYAASNRPRIMQGDWARVFLLFKQYGQNMVYTLTRNAYLSAKGDKQAMKTLAGILALHGTFAGVLGLPLATTLLGFASALGGDDDEPWNAEIALRNYLAELLGDGASEVISKGLPRALGIDLSSRVGLDSLILPRMQEGLEGQRAGESFTAAMTGPVAGIGVNAIAGFSDIQKAVTPNEYLIGTEKLLPKAFRDLVKTYRLAAYGNVDKTGVEIVPQENISLSDVGQQALGFRSGKIALAQEGKSAVFKMEKEIEKRRHYLMNRYAKAVLVGDTETADDTWQDIKRFNAGVGKDYPKLKITKPKLMQSVRQRRRKIEEAQDGIYLPNSREASRQYADFATE